MNLKELNKLHLEDYYWRLLFGKSKYRASFFELRSTGFKGMPTPVFFLSTGRCGTNWFTTLLSHEPSMKVFHEPKPNLGVQGKIAYETYREYDMIPPASEARLLEEIFLAGREQYLRYSYKTQRQFVETNNQITFLAPAIFSLFPETKFIHLNRHPGEFVRSALRRKFYNNPDDIKRIVPTSHDPIYNNWKELGPVGKNSWLWVETNQFIEKFRKTIPEENYFYFDFSKLNTGQVEKMNEFLGISISKSIISKAIGKPVNVQKSGKLEDYKGWPEEDKKSLISICKNMADHYNYQL